MNKFLVSVEDQGFRWGLGVFETLLVHKGVAQFQQMHLENMAEAAQVMGLPMPDAELWKKAPEGEGIWRWFLTPQAQLDSWEPTLPVLPDNYSLSFSPFKINSDSWEARHKTLSYLLRYQAKKNALTDEVILLNEQGYLASASMANLFWVKENKIYTPSLNSGCRHGVLRRWIEETWAGEWVEGSYQPEVLGHAEEIFVTNSRIGVMPIHCFEGKILEIGTVVKELQCIYAGTVEHLSKRTQRRF